MADTDDTFVFNGIDASSGSYLLQPMTAKSLVDLAQGREPDDSDKEAVDRFEAAKLEHFAPREDVDPKNLAEAGWGVIFAHDENPAVREALQPLLKHRQAVAGRDNPERYREFWGPTGYRPGERKPGFLARLKAPNSGPVDPDRMPYYLLIVGDPEKIPFEFQAQLDLQHAVGRLHFDTPEEYANYAHSVVATERGEVKLPRRISLFGVRNPDDAATNLSADGLIAGLDKYIRSKSKDWSLDVRLAEQATKAELAKVLGGPETPAVLFTASHGVAFPNGDPRQLPHQGALLCQDWPGPRRFSGPVPQDMYFAGDDLGDGARLAGLLHFIFACYGGGTPKLDNFFHKSGVAKPIAPRSFLAGLPRRMLGHPRGGALATVAHVERAWGCSFYSGKIGHQIAVFESFTKRLLDGHPIGSAMDFFGTRYGELSSGLLEKLQEIKYGNTSFSDTEIANDWTANNDARNYVILGDPAVRAPVVDNAQALPRPVLEVRSSASSAPAAPAPTPSVPVSAPAAPAPATTSATSQPPAVVEVAEAPASFGVFEDSPLKAIKVKLAAGMQGLADKLARRLHATVDDASAVEVSTYVSPDISAATFNAETKRFTGNVALRAFTRIDFDGDTQQVLPAVQGELDGGLWAAHKDAVTAAREHRTAMLKAGLDAIAGLFTAIKDL